MSGLYQLVHKRSSGWVLSRYGDKAVAFINLRAVNISGFLFRTSPMVIYLGNDWKLLGEVEAAEFGLTKYLQCDISRQICAAVRLLKPWMSSRFFLRMERFPAMLSPPCLQNIKATLAGQIYRLRPQKSDQEVVQEPRAVVFLGPVLVWSQRSNQRLLKPWSISRHPGNAARFGFPRKAGMKMSESRNECFRPEMPPIICASFYNSTNLLPVALTGLKLSVLSIDE